MLSAPQQLREVVAEMLTAQAERLRLQVVAVQLVSPDLFDSVLPAAVPAIQKVVLAGECSGGEVRIALRLVSNAQALLKQGELASARSGGDEGVVCRQPPGPGEIAALVATLSRFGFVGGPDFSDIEMHRACYVRPLQRGVWRQAMIVDIGWGVWLEGD